MKPEDAVDFLRDVSEVESSNRVDGLDDLKFRFGEQWPAIIQNSRNLESRPCLTINEIDAYCRQNENQQRQQRPRIKIHAVDSIADPKIAEVLGGITKHIEVNSNADWAYDTAFMFAQTIGWGYMRMRTDYVREDSFDQDIYIDQIENPFTVYFDPNSSLPDGSDAEKALITDLMTKDAFRVAYRGASTDGQGFSERAAGDTDSDWVTEHDIRLAEYYYVDRKKAELVKLSNGQVLWGDQISRHGLLTKFNVRVIETRESFKRVVKWMKCTQFEVLEERDIPGRWIPVIPVYGSSYIVNGRRIRLGLVRFAKDPQRMVNFWQTATTESIALAPKAKWLMPAGADEGYENEWAQANVTARPLLHYLNKVDGQDVPPPTRLQPEPPPAGAIEAAMQASLNLQRVLGIYDPRVGQSRQRKSDKTINAEEQQTDESNFHYYDNMTRSIKHVGRIILDWAPNTYDTQRVMRIIGEDGRPDQVTINEKKTDPTTGAVQEILNNVTIGEYDVVMDTGPGYNSKRQEAVAVFTNMLATPLGEKIAMVADDVIVRQMDVPGADVIADRLAAANPMAQIDDKSEIPPQAQMMIKGLQQHLEQAKKIIQEQGLELKYKTGLEKMRQDGDTQREHMKSVTKAHDTEMMAATKQHDVEARALTAQNVAEINAIAKLLVAHISTADLEKELTQRDKEAQAKANEPAATLQ